MFSKILFIVFFVLISLLLLLFDIKFSNLELDDVFGIRRFVFNFSFSRLLIILGGASLFINKFELESKLLNPELSKDFWIIFRNIWFHI